MLYTVNDYVLKAIVEDTTHRYLREAEVNHLLNEINPPQPSWLSHPAHTALRNWGRLLVTLGRRLDRIETRPA
jgi:hypothetical protein